MDGKNIDFYNIATNINNFIPRSDLIFVIIGTVLVAFSIYLATKSKYRGIPLQLQSVIRNSKHLKKKKNVENSGVTIDEDLEDFINKTFQRINAQTDSKFVMNKIKSYENIYSISVLTIASLIVVFFVVLNVSLLVPSLLAAGFVIYFSKYFKTGMIRSLIRSNYTSINKELNRAQILELDLMITYILAILPISDTMPLGRVIEEIMPLMSASKYDLQATLSDLNRTSKEDALKNWSSRLSVVEDSSMLPWIRFIDQIKKLFLQGEKDNIIFELNQMRLNQSLDFDKWLDNEYAKRSKQAIRGMYTSIGLIIVIFVIPLLLSIAFSLYGIFTGNADITL